MKAFEIRLLAFCVVLNTMGLGCLLAQDTGNMVYNPSFEQHTLCPERIEATGIMRGVDGWWQPTAGSSDYFHPCGGRECQVPKNKMGMQQAHSGQAYCGIYCSRDTYREYLQTQLRAPLQAGCTYKVVFYVSLADRSPLSVSSIGALFTRQRLADSTWNILRVSQLISMAGGVSQWVSRAAVPQVNSDMTVQLDDANGWTCIEGQFVAEGGEEFLTIGNFYADALSSPTPTNRANAVLPDAYYYIDDVEVSCLSCPAALPQENAITTVADSTLPAVGTTITLRNVLFDTDKSDLLPQSYADLQVLLRFMQEHPTACIEVRGHTDSEGTAEHNRQLSLRRAEAVVNYLKAHGISESRLRWHGYGEELPIADNATPEGRQQNRRVEYRVVEYRRAE